MDLEGALTANTITAPSGAHPPDGHPPEENVDDPQPMHPHLMERSPLRGRKRTMRGSGTPRGSQSKRGRRMSQQVDMPMMQPVPPSAPPEPQEKPDANMCLKVFDIFQHSLFVLWFIIGILVHFWCECLEAMGNNKKR